MKIARVAAAMIFLCVPSVAIGAPKSGRAAVIPKFVGTVNAGNALRFLGGITDRVDKIVGLQVFIEPSSDETFRKKHYSVDEDERQFSISSGATGDSGGLEMVAPAEEVQFLHGSYVLDGFYVVKSGGMHQGTASVGLEKVNEGAVLLSTKFRVVEKGVR